MSDFDPIQIHDLEMEATNVIQLESRRSYKCMHHRTVVDEALNEVQCKDCNEKLNPIWCLVRLAQEESRYVHEWRRSKEIAKRINEKKTTRCEHCNRMTRVNYKKTGLGYI